MTSTQGPPGTPGKGRPTPKRSEAQKRRRTAAGPPPANRKEAARAARARAAEARAEMRRALREGDERSYPPLHAGPERAAVRDAVDARPSVTGALIVGWVVLFAMGLSGSRLLREVSALGLFALLGLLVGDAIGASRAIRRALRARFPDGTTEKAGRLVRYGLARNASLRRSRVPAPRVSRRSRA